MSGFNPITIILSVNSFSIISLVLTQNEILKDAVNNKSSTTDPIELILGTLILIEFFIFLIIGKMNTF